MYANSFFELQKS